MGTIAYNKLFDLMKARGITSYRLFKDGVISSGTYQRMRVGKNITMDNIAALCQALNCQPGDILEYVE
jgi:DNA-binding Xre family transcriptional regulator